MKSAVSLVLLAATLAPAAAAHEPSRRLPAARSAVQAQPAPAGWADFGYATYPRPDFGAYGFVPGYAPPTYAPGPTPGPRVYVYPHGTRVWYGPGTPATANVYPPAYGSPYASAYRPAFRDGRSRR